MRQPPLFAGLYGDETVTLVFLSPSDAGYWTRTCLGREVPAGRTLDTYVIEQTHGYLLLDSPLTGRQLHVPFPFAETARLDRTTTLLCIDCDFAVADDPFSGEASNSRALPPSQIVVRCVALPTIDGPVSSSVLLEER